MSDLPAWTLGLPLEDTKLMVEKEHLELEAHLRAAADEEYIEEQTDEAVNDRQKHDAASFQPRPLAWTSYISRFSVPDTAGTRHRRFGRPAQSSDRSSALPRASPPGYPATVSICSASRTSAAGITR
jgi:hypothetical protein